MNNDELAAMIVRELGRHQDIKEVTRKVCEQSNLGWVEAEYFIANVAEKNKRKIAVRQSPLLLILSIGALLGGIGLVAYSIRFIFIFAQESTMLQILSLRSGYYVLGELATGVAMMGAGIYGLWNTIESLFSN